MVVADDIERALALELGVALAMEAALVVLVAGVGIGQCVHRSALGSDLAAFAVLDVDGRTSGVGQRQPVELHLRLERPFHIELAVGAGSREHIDNLTVAVGGCGIDACKVFCLNEDDVRRRAALHGDIRLDVVGNGD